MFMSIALPLILHRPRTMPPVGSAAKSVRNVGVAVVGPILDKTAVDRLRGVVSSRPEFVERTPNVPHRSRYFDPLCGGKSNRCQAWDSGFVSLVEHPYVLKEVEALLGSDCIVDSTACLSNGRENPPLVPMLTARWWKRR